MTNKPLNILLLLALLACGAGCGSMRLALPNEKPRPYELIVIEDRVQWDNSEEISMCLLVRKLGGQMKTSFALYGGLSMVWDGKEYKRDSIRGGGLNGSVEISPKTWELTQLFVKDYNVPLQVMTPGKHTLSIRDKFVESNVLTVFINETDNKYVDAADEKFQPYELVLTGNKIQYDDSEEISMCLLVRNLGGQVTAGSTLYKGLSMVWDEKEYKLDPKCAWALEISPRTAERINVFVKDYNVPLQVMTPGKHTLSIRDKFVESNVLTVFINETDNK